MLQVRALSIAGRPASIAVDRLIETPPGSFAPLPNRPPAPIVFAIHPQSPAAGDWSRAAAQRSYLSEGLASPDAYLAPRGWLIDVTA